MSLLLTALETSTPMLDDSLPAEGSNILQSLLERALLDCEEAVSSWLHEEHCRVTRWLVNCEAVAASSDAEGRQREAATKIIRQSRALLMRHHFATFRDCQQNEKEIAPTREPFSTDVKHMLRKKIAMQKQRVPAPTSTFLLLVRHCSQASLSGAIETVL